jgi:peptidyl-prolyl cis-trans isomerase SurA
MSLFRCFERQINQATSQASREGSKQAGNKGVVTKMKKAGSLLTAALLMLLTALTLCGVFVRPVLAADPPSPPKSANAVEGVVAVVGDEIILKSELDEQVAFYLMQAKISTADTARVNEARREILDRMIDAKVIVNEARRLKVTVSKEELDKAVEDAIKEVKTRMGSEEKFQQQLEKEGLTEEKLRSKYRQELNSQLLAMKLVERDVRSKIKVTDQDVDSFYADRKQDLPKKPAEVTLAQIVILAQADSAVEKEARDKAQQILDSIKVGHSFEQLAAEYSDDPSAENGGDVGFVKKGDFEGDFEKAALALKPGQVSGLIRTRFGYHIIKLVEKDEDSYHIKHILIKVVPTDEEEQKARTLATDIRKKIEAGESFEDLAKKYSEDKESADKGGLVGSYPVDGLAPAVKNAIKGVPVGGVTEVVPLEIGYHIFKVMAKTAERDYDFSEIKDQLREMVLQEKAQNKYEQWLADIKKRTYIDVKGS